MIFFLTQNLLLHQCSIKQIDFAIIRHTFTSPMTRASFSSILFLVIIMFIIQ